MRRSIHLSLVVTLLPSLSCQRVSQDGDGDTRTAEAAQTSALDEPTEDVVQRNPEDTLLFFGEGNRCAFDIGAMTYLGTPAAQARCLLRPVARYADIEEPLNELPETIYRLVGKPVHVTKATLTEYLRQHQIDENDIGGLLDDPVSRANRNDQHAPSARYFVIHDTSTPLYQNDQSFPEDINEPTWRHNRLSRWIHEDGGPSLGQDGQPDSIAHVFINRTGESVTPVKYDAAYFATKFELRILGRPREGLYLHHELIQPRRADDRGIDAFSPDPGFSEAQLDRLALIYFAASIRGGEFMIPAFHAVVDTGIPMAHDDPQNFDLSMWAESLSRLDEELGRLGAS